jgi:hypothetical protein
MHWSYDEVQALPIDVYGVLIESVNAGQIKPLL